MLEKLDDGLWTVGAPLRFLGFRIGTRMTVVRLRDGGLLVHSPVPLDEQLRSELDALGPVRHIVCPNLFHHLYAGPMVAAYPHAKLHGPRGLRGKRKDLAFDFDLSEEPHPDWADDLLPLTIEGSRLHETVFLHPRSRTLITSDIAENFETSDHLPTRLYLKVSGLHGRIGWSRLLRFVYRDRRAARASIDRLLEWDFERVILAHGRLVEREGREAVRGSYTWL